MKELKPPTWDIRCGTDAGEKAHRRRDEKPCASCLACHSRAVSRRRFARQGGPKEHHDHRCTRCGWFLKVQPDGMRCANERCITIGAHR